MVSHERLQQSLEHFLAQALECGEKTQELKRAEDLVRDALCALQGEGMGSESESVPQPKVHPERTRRGTYIEKHLDNAMQRTVRFSDFPRSWSLEEKVKLFTERYTVENYKVVRSKRSREIIVVVFKTKEDALCAVIQLHKAELSSNVYLRVRGTGVGFRKYYREMFPHDKDSYVLAKYCRKAMLILLPFLAVLMLLGLSHRTHRQSRNLLMRYFIGYVYPAFVCTLLIGATVILIHVIDLSDINWWAISSLLGIMCLLILSFLVLAHSLNEFDRPGSESSLFEVILYSVGSKNEEIKLTKLTRIFSVAAFPCTLSITVLSWYALSRVSDKFLDNLVPFQLVWLKIATFYAFGIIITTTMRVNLYAHLATSAIDRLKKNFLLSKYSFQDFKYRYYSFGIVIGEVTEREGFLFVIGMGSCLLSAANVILSAVFLKAGTTSMGLGGPIFSGILSMLCIFWWVSYMWPISAIQEGMETFPLLVTKSFLTGFHRSLTPDENQDVRDFITHAAGMRKSYAINCFGFDINRKFLVVCMQYYVYIIVILIAKITLL